MKQQPFASKADAIDFIKRIHSIGKLRKRAAKEGKKTSYVSSGSSVELVCSDPKCLAHVTFGCSNPLNPQHSLTLPRSLLARSLLVLPLATLPSKWSTVRRCRAATFTPSMLTAHHQLCQVEWHISLFICWAKTFTSGFPRSSLTSARLLASLLPGRFKWSSPLFTAPCVAVSSSRAPRCCCWKKKASLGKNFALSTRIPTTHVLTRSLVGHWQHSAFTFRWVYVSASLSALHLTHTHAQQWAKTQFMMGFQAPFIMTIILWPLNFIEYALIWAVNQNPSSS